MPGVSISNESAYIRVTHPDGIVIFYVKATLVVQKLSDNVFMLKCDSFEKFYDYNDVVAPATANLDELLTKITAWNTALSNTFATLNTGTIFFRIPQAPPP